MTSALVTCSGVSNTGRLTTQAPGPAPAYNRAGYLDACKAVHPSLQHEIADADNLIVVDGCGDCCAKKKLSSSRIVPDHHIIATELDVEKKGMGEVRYDEIEIVVRAVMEIGIKE